MTKNKKKVVVSLLDYGAGNVRSVRNAILQCGCDEIIDITEPKQIEDADIIVFPGVGSFQTAMQVLKEKKFDKALKQYLQQDRPFLGICLGMQTLFESSQETGHDDDGDKNTNQVIDGLGVIPGQIVKFDESKGYAVPHIGWNGRILHQTDSPVFKYVDNNEDVYFVHSYYAPWLRSQNNDWVLTTTNYGGFEYISSIQKGNIVATQFHPEKSGKTGLHLLQGFLEAASNGTLNSAQPMKDDDVAKTTTTKTTETQLTKRVVVALDVRSNDHGDLVVTKGDQYDVRESSNHDDSDKKGQVRNLGKPVALARRYYEEGADEIAFLNITSFRHGVIEDMPMLQVLEQASENIFVPLTVGGGIRSYTDPDSGQTWSALQVASRYFRAGADKISLGSDAVYAAEDFVKSNGAKTGTTSIEMISKVYGVQAVVISIDPQRVYVPSKDDVPTQHVAIELDETQAGPNGERCCWYQCTVKGGREARDICAVTLAKSCEALGAGEIMANCIDTDGQCSGFDHALMNALCDAVSIPVIASSGAGTAEHFSDVFTKTNVQAALAAGMFHRKEVEIEAVKQQMRKCGIPARRTAASS